MEMLLVRLLLVALVLPLWTTSAWADSDSDCNQSEDFDRKISGCTRIIDRGTRESPEDRSTAYTYRGYAYYKKQDYNRAIADFSEAIERVGSNQ
jgi:tetratricopeptide (TPR) repeat protein